ncbi:MAG: 30S ribosomal protein S17 [Candidatus Omnitrophota bacterium]
MQSKNPDKEKGKVLTGIVTSDKMQKTIVVKVTRLAKHPLYKKYVKKYGSFKAHDEKDEAKVGNTVIIKETRPLSKDKRWRLIKVVE